MAVDAFEALTYTAKWKPVMSKTVGRHTDDSGFQMPSVQLVDTNRPTVLTCCCIDAVGPATNLENLEESGYLKVDREQLGKMAEVRKKCVLACVL